MKNIIRYANIDDLVLLLEIEKKCFKPHDRFKRGQFRYLIDDGTGYFYVSEQGSTILGYGYISITGRIYSIASVEAGIGRKLMDSLESHHSKQYLEVRADNGKALKFFKKRGFKVEERIKNYYPDKMDAIKMRR